MKFSLDTLGGQHVIRSYAAGEVRVDDQVLRRSFLLSADTLIGDWPPQTLEQLRAEHLEHAVALDPEVVVLGVGRQQRFPGAAVVAPLYRRQIGLEVMTTDAACRTYNILRGEDRRVVAAILMLEHDREER